MSDYYSKRTYAMKHHCSNCDRDYTVQEPVGQLSSKTSVCPVCGCETGYRLASQKGMDPVREAGSKEWGIGPGDFDWMFESGSPPCPPGAHSGKECGTGKEWKGEETKIPFRYIHPGERW